MAVGVAGFLIYFLARRHNAASAAAELPPLLSLVPSDSTVLIYADLATLRESPFMMQLAALAPPAAKDPDYADFVRATGFDYERDLDRVVLAIQGEEKSAVTTAVADGRFDQNKISAYALRFAKEKKQNGDGVYFIPSKSPGKSLAIRFLSANRIALASNGGNSGPAAPSAARNSDSKTLSSPAAASSAAERRDSLAPEMRERLARVSGAPLFAVAKLDARRQPENFLPGGLRSDQLENLVRNMRWLILAARPAGDRLDVTVEGECDTAENARQLAGTLDGLRMMGQMALSDRKTRRQMDAATLPLVEALLRTAEVSSADKSDAHRVRLTFAVTQKMLASPKK